MRLRKGLVRFAAAVGAAAALSGAIGQPATPSVLAGAYTEEQAIRGQALYDTHCHVCHGETMAGLDQAPPLAGPQFASVWQGDPLQALVERIGAMPPDRPATLSRAESVDILAYILWYNGLPIGEKPLDTKQSVLAALTFESPTLPAR